MTRELLGDVEAALFDWDDTCVATMGPKIEQNIFTAKKYYNVDLTRDDVLAEWSRNSFPELIKKLFKTDDFEGAMVHIRRHYDEFPKRLFPDTVPTFQKLGSRGLWLGVVSSVSQEIFRTDVSDMQFPVELLDNVQTADDTKVHKPNPDVFAPTLLALAKLGINNRRRIVYVGDALNDRDAAEEAGLRFIGITRGAVSADEFRDHGAVCIDNLEELAA